MATSGITSLGLTARDIIVYALRKIGAIPIAQEPSEAEISPVIIELNLMLKEWETNGPHLWRKTDGSVSIVANTASYALSPQPLRIIECRYRYPSDGVTANQRDLPMTMMTSEEYKTLPMKLTTGSIPTMWYFDPQETTSTLYIWPLMSSVTTDSVVFTYQRRFEIIDSLNNSVDIPDEWMSTVAYCLADRILIDYGITGEIAQRISMTAERLITKAKAFDREDEVRFMPSYRYRRR